MVTIGVSSCGRYIASVDKSNDHRVTIYNLQRKVHLATVNSGKSEITDLKWSKRVDDLRFATIGPKEIYFWHPADVTKKLQHKGSF